MKFLKCCGGICLVLDTLVLIPIFGTSTTYIVSRYALGFGSTVDVFVYFWICLC